MAGVLSGLVNRAPVDVGTWRGFWDRLHAGRLHRGEAAAVLASLSTRMPDPATLAALLDSLDERRPRPAARFAGAVNIVGTGGGPRTVNISTAAALVAAAQGVPVIKTGSRGYSGGVGSFDLLDRLGIPLLDSHEAVGEALARCGVAFAGYFVYPAEVALLVRAVAPLDIRTLGRFVNAVGPFLADVPVPVQLTGVADAARRPALAALARRECRRAPGGRRIWLCDNDLGADELVSFAGNALHPPDGAAPVPLPAGAVAPAGGDLADLAPAADPASVVGRFRALLAGEAPPAAVRTVCLNAAVLAALAGGGPPSPDGLRSAYAGSVEVVTGGHALRLLDRVAATVGARGA
ncbi:MAG TPA: hypothetical protein VNV66_15180 [Pilimelia sp.]|nr:hypothetical protein [Pilimelia sp.]